MSESKKEKLENEITHLAGSTKAAAKLRVPVTAVLDVSEARAILLLRKRSLKLLKSK